MLMCFLSSMACTNCFRELGCILKETFHKESCLLCHVQSYPWLDSPGEYQIHIWNLSFLIQSHNHESFDPHATCMWKTCGEEFFLGLQYFKSLGEQELTLFRHQVQG